MIVPLQALAESAWNSLGNLYTLRSMSPWLEFNETNLKSVPSDVPGVFQLARGEGNIAFVGGAAKDIQSGIRSHMGAQYTHFQWVQLPWEKEVFEMQCRLFHHAGGKKRLDNEDHPYPPEGKFWRCTMSLQSRSVCEI